MLEVYWGLLIGGALFVIVTILLGDVLDAVFDGMLDFLSIKGANFIHPFTLIGGLTMMGGAGVLLTQYTSLAPWSVFVLALCIALVGSSVLYFIYLKPMRKAENSIAYSFAELVGQIVSVSVPIPAEGYGEVIVKVGAGRTNEIAASWERKDLDADSRVVVVEAKDGVLYVASFE